jgi:hypothetical protein
MDFDAFRRERNEALLSLDPVKLRAYLLKWNGDPGPSDQAVFMFGIDKAITACKDLPLEFRRAAKKRLEGVGMESLDDGDL